MKGQFGQFFKFQTGFKAFQGKNVIKKLIWKKGLEQNFSRKEILRRLKLFPNFRKFGKN